MIKIAHASSRSFLEKKNKRPFQEKAFLPGGTGAGEIGPRPARLRSSE